MLSVTELDLVMPSVLFLILLQWCKSLSNIAIYPEVYLRVAIAIDSVFLLNGLRRIETNEFCHFI